MTIIQMRGYTPYEGEYRPSASNFTLNGTYTGYIGPGIDFSDDGALMFVADISNIYNAEIRKYQLSSPYDISTATLLTTDTLSGARGYNCNIRKSGEYLYISDEVGDKYRQYTLSTAYDVSTATLTNNINSPGVYVYEGYMAKDGKHMYLGNGYYSSFVTCYKLSTDWDITTATEVGSKLTSTVRDAFGGGFCIRDDGTYAYINIGGIVYSGGISTPYDMSTFTSDGQFSHRGGVFYDGRTNLFLNDDGTIYHYISS